MRPRPAPIPRFGYPVPRRFAPAKLADVFGSTSTATHGVYREVRPGGHTGWDIRVDEDGVKARPIAPGRVYAITAPPQDCGHGVRLDHGHGWTSTQCHYAAAPLVTIGQRVRRRTVLGIVGATGNANYRHLHLSVEHHGRRVDPLLLFLSNHGLWERRIGRAEATLAELEAWHDAMGEPLAADAATLTG